MKQLGLKERSAFYVELRDVNGDRIDKTVGVASLQVGGLSYGETTFYVANDIEGLSVEQEGGLFGHNLLSEIDLEIDNKNKSISLFSQDHCPGYGVYWADEAVTLKYKKQPTGQRVASRLKGPSRENQIDLPIVLADLEGEEVAVLFDTGATFTTIDIESAKRRFGIGPGSPGVEPAGLSYAANGDAMETYSYTFKSLSIAGITFENVPVRLAKFNGVAQILLGMNEIKHLRLYFSFKEGLIHITAADAGSAPAQ